MLSKGFTLIEVMITLVILLFGLLGIAGLMANGQRAAFEAYQRQQALIFANDMAERIRENPTAALTYTDGAPVNAALGTGNQYNQLVTGAITNCNPGPCSTTQQLALYDLAVWDGQLCGYGEQVNGGAATPCGGQQVGGILNARGCIEDKTVNPAASCPSPSNGVYTYTQSLRISVAWQGNSETISPTLSACGGGDYGTDTQRRLAAIDLILIQQCPSS